MNTENKITEFQKKTSQPPIMETDLIASSFFAKKGNGLVWPYTIKGNTSNPHRSDFEKRDRNDRN